jgi:hypothetical protein
MKCSAHLLAACQIHSRLSEARALSNHASQLLRSSCDVISAAERRYPCKPTQYFVPLHERIPTFYSLSLIFPFPFPVPDVPRWNNESSLFSMCATQNTARCRCPLLLPLQAHPRRQITVFAKHVHETTKRVSWTESTPMYVPLFTSFSSVI